MVEVGASSFVLFCVGIDVLGWPSSFVSRSDSKSDEVVRGGDSTTGFFGFGPPMRKSLDLGIMADPDPGEAGFACGNFALDGWLRAVI